MHTAIDNLNKDTFVCVSGDFQVWLGGLDRSRILDKVTYKLISYDDAKWLLQQTIYTLFILVKTHRKHGLISILTFTTRGRQRSTEAFIIQHNVGSILWWYVGRESA